MNFFDHRQIRTTCTLNAFYLPQKGYIGGYFSGAKPALDVQGINNAQFNRNIQQSSFQTSSASGSTTTSLIKQNLSYNQSSNLRDLKEFQGGLLPTCNSTNGASLCTFAFGGISPKEAHPVYDTLIGPEYVVSFEDSAKTIESYSLVGSTNVQPSNTPYIPFYKDSKLGNAKQFTTYNIWNIVDNKSLVADKYNGPILDSPTNIRTITDTVQGAIVDVSAVNSYIVVERAFPTSKDVVYESPDLYYEQTANVWKYLNIKASGNRNAGFILKMGVSTPLSDSFIEVIISDKSAQNLSNRNRTAKTISNYRIKYFPNDVPELWYEQPETKELLLFNKLDGLSGISPSMELYVHFVAGTLFIGQTSDPSNWKAIPPIPVNNSNIKYEHSIGSNVYPSIAINNINVQFQYSAIVFNHLYSEDKDVNNHGIYLKNQFKAPVEKQDKISGEYISSNVLNNIYLGNHTNNIDNYKEPISIYADSRVSNPFEIQNSGIVADGKLSVKNDVALFGNGVIDGSIYMRLENNPGILSSVNNQTINNKNDEVNYNINSANVVTNVSNNTKTIPNILEFIDKADLSSYVESWSVDVSCENPNLSRISKTAEVVLYNVDHTPEGAKIIDLLERNLLVVKLTAGYGMEQHTYFEGFCNDITVEKSGSETKFTLSCQDIGTFSLSNIYFEYPLLLTGLSIFRASDYLIACSGFADHYYRLPGNNRFNFYGSLKLDPNAVQRQDVVVCQVTDKILEKLDTVLSLLFNKKAYPTLRWDEPTQKLIFDARHNYLDSDFKFIGTIETQNEEIIVVDSNYQQNIPDWHGLLSGGYTIKVQNSELAAGVKSFGLTLDGFKVKRTPESKIESKLSLQARNRVVNALNSNSPVAGYVGFRKYIIDSVDKNNVPSDQIITNRYELISLVSQTTLHNINFTCYVTKPLRPYGTFLINLLINDQTSQTDPYIYQKVSYSFSKENNYITANVTGFNDILPIVKG